MHGMRPPVGGIVRFRNLESKNIPTFEKADKEAARDKTPIAVNETCARLSSVTSLNLAGEVDYHGTLR